MISVKKVISFLTSASMAVLSVIPATASAADDPGVTLLSKAEEQQRDYTYYTALDDYAVYREYCETYGFAVMPELPAKADMPDYDLIKYYLRSPDHYIQFEAAVKDGLSLYEQELAAYPSDPTYFGFPADWYFTLAEETGEDTPHHVIELSGLGGMAGVTFSFDELAYNDTGEIPVMNSMMDAYRVQLALEHSAFAEEWLMERDDANGHMLSAEPLALTAVPGDTNGDGVTDALDAADILAESAAAGAGLRETFTELQNEAADLNGDGKCDALDAALILQYSAAAGSGQDVGTIEAFVQAQR